MNQRSHQNRGGDHKSHIVPSHALPPHLRRTEAELLGYLEAEFRDDADFILGLRLEGGQEAIDRTSPKEGAFKHSRLVPFRRTDDARELREQLDNAKSLIAELEALFAARCVSPEFLARWGAFQYACGYVTNAYFARGDDLGPLRSAIQGPRAKDAERKRRWVAHLLRRQLHAGRSRQESERDVAKAIRNLLNGVTLPAGFEASWFSELLTADKQLRSTYSRKHLSEAAIETLVTESISDLPPTDIEIPKI